MSASADSFKSGNDLYEDCRRSSEICLGYVQGVFDVMSASTVYDGINACASNVTVGQVRDVVVQYLAANPARRHVMAAQLVALALADAFPCRR
jgi:hypothetical protein